MSDTKLSEWFDGQRRMIRDAYLRTGDQHKQSGWQSTPERWRLGREPIAEAVAKSGSFLDIGCANGLLLESLIEWSGARGREIEPHGIDVVPELIELARKRLPRGAFAVANGFDWIPQRRYDYVHTLLEFVPEQQHREYLVRFLDLAVAPGGRLIVSNYGSRTRNQAPIDVAAYLVDLGFVPAGSAVGRDLDGVPITRVAWVEKR